MSGPALAAVDLLIGIDDTDDATSPGTGRRCRQLADELAAAGLGRPAGATRHQLLVDPRIPYTSHNSSACIGWRSAGADPVAVLPEVVGHAGAFLERVCPPAADPGLAVAIPQRLPGWSALVDFGLRAKRHVLSIDEATALATATGVHLSGHGGTHGGRIGALAAVGLHLSGDDGLFLFLPGIRDLEGRLTAEELRRRVPIDRAFGPGAQEPAPDEVIDLGDWVRPVLLAGEAVLLLDPPTTGADGVRRWRTAPRAVVKQY
ncbi:hypothetical protein ACFQE5_04395 [Pseudonocardia hispaniensis]|uniref:tRNA(Ile2) 2-agmatinylcytidine synthetase n=1 Tax=Pseudonocardia hispaniensis TaxID=904933 RepID=A0ABW1IYJ2_9PSEU